MKIELKVGYETINRAGEKVRLMSSNYCVNNFPLLWIRTLKNKTEDVCATTLDGFVSLVETKYNLNIDLSEFDEKFYDSFGAEIKEGDICIFSDFKDNFEDKTKHNLAYFAGYDEEGENAYLAHTGRYIYCKKLELK